MGAMLKENETRGCVSPTNTIHVTIGITCYNAEDTISRALNSALNQDWAHFEIVIVDDYSSDGSWRIISEFAARYSCIRPVRHEFNQGAAAARNTILYWARGEFVAFFDDDDASLPQRVRVQYDTLMAYELRTGSFLNACYASGVRRYPNGYECEMPGIGSQPLVPVGTQVVDYLLFNSRHRGCFYGAGTPTCALMARISTFTAVGGFDASLRRVEDADLAIRIGLQGGHFIGCRERLFVQYATVSLDKTSRKNFESEIALTEKYADYLKSRRSYHYAVRWFTIRYLRFSGKKWRFLGNLTIFFLRYPIRSSAHWLYSIPRRLAHERRMKRGAFGTK
jgi:glycosyltransferase involved in cell wall biosynthesis